MRSNLQRIVLAFVIVLVLALPFTAVHAGGDLGLGTQIGTINVVGEAQINVVPDEVIITLGVETSDLDLGIAKGQNDKRVAQVLALAKTFEIPQEYVKTDFMSVEMRYDDSSHHVFIGYFVRKTIVFTVKDMAKFEDLLSAALNSGANFLQGVQFRTSELRKYRDQARSLAIKAAREKADALAGDLGQKVGKAITINEEQGNYWAYYNAWGYQNGYQNMSQNVMQNAGGSSASAMSGDTTVAPGQISVTARVGVTFALTE
jgi:uncharacterized protein YggE